MSNAKRPLGNAMKAADPAPEPHERTENQRLPYAQQRCGHCHNEIPIGETAALHVSSKVWYHLRCTNLDGTPKVASSAPTGAQLRWTGYFCSECNVEMPWQLYDEHHTRPTCPKCGRFDTAIQRDSAAPSGEADKCPSCDHAKHSGHCPSCLCTGTMTAPNREKFEKWHKDEFGYVGQWFDQQNRYFYSDTQTRWEAWQAAKGCALLQRRGESCAI